MSTFDPALEGELLTQDFRHMLVQWGADRAPRTGLHASSLLVPDKDWCLREHVLHNLYPEQGEPEEQGPPELLPPPPELWVGSGWGSTVEVSTGGGCWVVVVGSGSGS